MSALRHSSHALAALLLSSVAMPAFAQDAPDTAQAEPAQSEGGLGEIVVTAERREQNLQDVSISATVLGGEELISKGVQNVADLQQVAPSVAINTFNRSTFINIRGVGIAQSAPTSNPGVAFYVDGQLIPHEQFVGQAFFDIGSIEVLRGPQGTLTGQNSTGGAIYIRTPAPEFDHVFGYVDQTVGNYDWYKTVAAVNIPFSDNVAIRAAATYDTRDSYTTNIGRADSQPGSGHLLAGRLNFAARSPDDRIQVNLRVDAFDSKSDNNPVKRRNDTVSSDPFVIEEDANSFQNQNGYRLAGEARFPVTDGINFRMLVAHQDQETIDQTDGDRSATAQPRPPASNTGRITLVSTKFQTQMAEFNLLSDSDGPFNYVVGGFWLYETVGLLSQRDNNHTREFVSSTSTIRTKAFNTSKSLFGQVNWFVVPQLELIAGARHSWDQQIYDRFVVSNVVTPAGQIRGIQQSQEWTGRIGANYHVGDDTMLYVTASRGYKAGGVNLTPNTANFQPETNQVIELGFKTTLLDRHLRINGDVFRSDYQDIQLSSLQNGLPVTQNAASGESWGGELEILADFAGFRVNAGVGYLDAKFAEDTCITDTNSPGTDPGCPTNLRFVPEGRTLPFSPEWTINAGAQYDIALGGDVILTPRVQWAHLAEQNATPFPSVNTIVPARDVFDARLSLAIGEMWQVEGFVNNFTDKVYIASQIQNSSSADGGIIYGAPRTFGVRLKVNIGQ